MKATSKLLMVCILLVLGGQALAIDSQVDTEKKAEFRKLILQRNQLHNKLQQRDIQAAELTKNGKDATRINAEQVTIQDRLDLLQLRIETLAARYDFVMPDLPNEKTAAEMAQREADYGLDAFARGRHRTKEELKRQTLRLLASIDYSQFRAKIGDK